LFIPLKRSVQDYLTYKEEQDRQRGEVTETLAPCWYIRLQSLKYTQTQTQMLI